MIDQLIIRRVTPADFDQWQPLWSGYNLFYERVLAPEITAVTWSRLLDPAEPIFALVAESHGSLMGIAHYIIHLGTTMIEPTFYLSDLFTAGANRGMGVGRALIEGVYNEARAARSKRVYWQTQETNAIARKLYDQVAVRSGFIVYRHDL